MGERIKKIGGSEQSLKNPLKKCDIYYMKSIFEDNEISFCFEEVENQVQI